MTSGGASSSFGGIVREARETEALICSLSLRVERSRICAHVTFG